MSDTNIKEAQEKDVTPITQAEDSAEMLTIPVETLNKVLNVLASLPYTQVAEVIAEVQQNAKKA